MDAYASTKGGTDTNAPLPIRKSGVFYGQRGGEWKPIKPVPARVPSDERQPFFCAIGACNSAFADSSPWAGLK